jgi:hypothetical protein
MTKLIPDVINNIFSFMINNYDIWIPTIDYYYEIKMKINRNSILIQNLEQMLLFKVNNQIQSKIIQIYNEDSGTKTIHVYTFDIVTDNYLIEYSYYYQNNTNDYMKYQPMNCIIIHKNNDPTDTSPYLYDYDGYGSVIDGYHHYYKNNRQITNKLNNSYLGFMSSYRLFPTIENATLYEFDE